jgi:pyrroloquinoline quinone (PQQ) biosynthesis protein C
MADGAAAAAAADPASQPLDNARVRHSRFVVDEQSGTTVILAGTRSFALSGQPAAGAQFMETVRYLDGRHTVSQISSATGISTELISRIISSLRELGLIEQRKNADALSVPVFASEIEERAAACGRLISNHALFRGLGRHEVRKEVFLGLMLETYHYVKSAPRHIATAIAHCRDPWYEPALTQYFVEEHSHASLVLDTVERLGLGREEARQSYPVAGTTVLIQMLCEIARTDTLSYLACTTLLEARATDIEASAATLRRICTGYGWPADAMAPLDAHIRADLDAGHASLLSRVLCASQPVPADQVQRSVNWLHDLKHVFEIYYDQILKYYSDASHHIPRLPV